MAFLGQGIAFGSVAIGAAWMEVSGIDASWLWFLLLVWAVSTEWHPK